MRSVTSFSIETERLQKLKNACDQHRITVSAYLDFALDNAPPITEALARYIAARKKGSLPVSYEEFASRKDVLEIVGKGWHFHRRDDGSEYTCTERECSLPRVTNPDYYEDSEGNVRITSTGQIFERAELRRLNAPVENSTQSE